MTIFNTAYETSACKHYLIKPIIDELCRLTVANGGTNPIEKIGSDVSFPMVTEVCSDWDGQGQVKAFSHPIAIAIDKDRGYKVWVDVRPFGKFNRDQGVFQVTNRLEYYFTTLRAALTHVWVNLPNAQLRDFSNVPVTVYTRWISEAVAQRFALAPAEAWRLSILVGIYYYSLFFNTLGEEIGERERIRIGKSVAQACSANLDDVFMMMDTVGVSSLDNLQSLCAAMKEHIDPVRLKDVSDGILCTLIANTWFNSNGKEVLAVALEHPPTWIAVLTATMQERSYNRSQIGRLVEKVKHQEQTLFINTVTGIVEAD